MISDTHGLLRPEAIRALRGCQQILHAGDVGSPEILEELGQIAPLTAVRGNVDRDAWANRLPYTRVIEIESRLLYMLHDLGQLDLDPAAAGFRAVISGHSHQPKVEERAGVLYLNPGSAGPRRFKLPVCVAVIEINGDMLTPGLIPLRV